MVTAAAERESMQEVMPEAERKAIEEAKAELRCPFRYCSCPWAAFSPTHCWSYNMQLLLLLQPHNLHSLEHTATTQHTHTKDEQNALP
jgi:hypothetical protein